MSFYNFYYKDFLMNFLIVVFNISIHTYFLNSSTILYKKKK